MDVIVKQKGTPVIANMRFSICLAIFWAAGIGILSGCHHELLPAKLVGAWISSDARFEGRVLTISPNTVKINVHEKMVASYLIKNVSVVSEARLLRVVLALEQEQRTASRMILNYDPQRDTLWLESRPSTLWYRAAEE